MKTPLEHELEYLEERKAIATEAAQIAAKLMWATIRKVFFWIVGIATFIFFVMAAAGNMAKNEAPVKVEQTVEKAKVVKHRIRAKRAAKKCYDDCNIMLDISEPDGKVLTIESVEERLTNA